MAEKISKENLEEDETKKEEEKEKSTKQRNKIIIIVIVVFISIVSILYCLYMFEAFKKKWYPFTIYVIEKAPEGGVLPNGPTSTNLPVSEAEEDEDYKEVVQQLTEVNKQWYDSKYAIPKPKNQND